MSDELTMSFVMSYYCHIVDMGNYRQPRCMKFNERKHDRLFTDLSCIYSAYKMLKCDVWVENTDNKCHIPLDLITFCE